MTISVMMPTNAPNAAAPKPIPMRLVKGQGSSTAENTAGMIQAMPQNQ